LFKLKHYSHCLFFCHLSLEKLLKGLVVKETKTHAPFVHDLVYLAKLTNLNFIQEQIKDLEEINKFNIKARYDNEKLKFYFQTERVKTKTKFLFFRVSAENTPQTFGI